MTVAKRLTMLVVLTAIFAGCNDNGNSEGNGRPDPWADRIARLEREYRQNREKLLSDWRLVLAEFKKGDIDATKMAEDIIALRRRVDNARERLDRWTTELQEPTTNRR